MPRDWSPGHPSLFLSLIYSFIPSRESAGSGVSNTVLLILKSDEEPAWGACGDDRPRHLGQTVQARQREGMNGDLVQRPSRCQPGAGIPESSAQNRVSGPASPAGEAPLSGGVAWPGAFTLCSSSPPTSFCLLGSSSGWGYLEADAHPLSCPALPCPELGWTLPTPGYCLQHRPASSLQPSSTPCLQGLFPSSCSNHTPRFREEPLLFLPPPSPGVGLKKKAQLTAALLSQPVPGSCPRCDRVCNLHGRGGSPGVPRGPRASENWGG